MSVVAILAKLGHFPSNCDLTKRVDFQSPPFLRFIMVKRVGKHEDVSSHRKKRFEKLSGPGIQITEVAPVIWGRSIDERDAREREYN